MRQADAQDMQRISFHTAFALKDTSVGAPVSLQLKLWVRLCLTPAQLNLLSLLVKLDISCNRTQIIMENN